MTTRAARSLSLFTMPSGVGFADAMAGALLEDPGLGGRWQADNLSELTILLPTRRAVRALSEAFLRASDGRALLLPSIRPLGDVDEEELLLDPGTRFAEGALGAALPPAMDGLERQMVLTRLILKWGEVNPKAGIADPGQAAALAGDLGRFLDAVETEGVSLSALKDLVPHDYAENWQLTLEFLQIVTAHWPGVLQERGLIDPAARRTMLLEAQAAAWEAKPPKGPVIAAGSTGSVPASAKLLSVIARLPQGAVVLPGLDLDLDEEAWGAIGESHPQFGMKQLLGRLGAARDDVAPWPDSAREEAARVRLLNEALRPAEVTDRWRDMIGPLKEEMKDALQGLTLIEAQTPREEAAAIALIMRGVLEMPEKTAALVTPDRALARRVAGELQRWNIRIDDSSGVPLADAPVFLFLRLLLQAFEEKFAPVALLALLKHPLAALGGEPGRFKADIRRLERALLRGPRPAPGMGGLRLALHAYEEERRQKDPALAALITQLEEAVEPLAALWTGEPQPLKAVTERLITIAETLAAAKGASGAERLWAGEEGEAASTFFAGLLEKAGEAPPVPPRGLRAFLESLALGRAVRPRFGRHPRLAILGPLEARLYQADCMILSSLNEGVWPAETKVDPWLSRPMRRDLGLYSPERRIGLSAHDFIQAASGRETFLTRALKVDGAPAVPSRWLLRLESLLGGAGLSLPRDEVWCEWAQELDKPGASPKPVDPPRPAPPLAARPDGFSVTDVETLIRDPYALYAKKVLGLRVLEPLDNFAAARDRGIVIHKAMEAFMRAHPENLPEDIESALLEAGETAFKAAPDRPEVTAFWKPRFAQIAAWAAEEERKLREGVTRVHAECKGSMEIGGLKRPVTLTARADRIDERADGALALLDFKTGFAPSAAQVESGFSPQLPLEAAIAEAGGFEGIGAKPAGDLRYLRLTGGEKGGENRLITEEGALWAAEALAGLRALLASYESDGVPYLSRPRVQFTARFSNYDHLARVKEWSAAGAEGEGE